MAASLRTVDTLYGACMLPSANKAFSQSSVCSCTNASSNLLTNGSFENKGTGWSVSGGSLTFGTTYAVCDKYNAYLTYTCSGAKIWQRVSSISGGKTVTFKAWAGTHTKGIACSPKLTLYFYNSSNSLLKSYSVNSC